VAILASRATRPVRWRRQLRAACFWLALGLGSAAVARELGESIYYTLCVPPLALAARDLIRAFGARAAGRLAERVADGLTNALGPDYLVLTEYAPRAGTGVVPSRWLMRSPSAATTTDGTASRHKGYITSPIRRRAARARTPRGCAATSPAVGTSGRASMRSS